MSASGGCHCGAVRFIARCPSRRCRRSTCNCSICSMTGFLHIIVPHDDFTLERGARRAHQLSLRHGRGRASVLLALRGEELLPAAQPSRGVERQRPLPRRAARPGHRRSSTGATGKMPRPRSTANEPLARAADHASRASPPPRFRRARRQLALAAARRAGRDAGRRSRPTAMGLARARSSRRLGEAGCRDFFVSTWAEAEALGPLPDGRER